MFRHPYIISQQSHKSGPTGVWINLSKSLTGLYRLYTCIPFCVFHRNWSEITKRNFL